MTLFPQFSHKSSLTYASLVWLIEFMERPECVGSTVSVSKIEYELCSSVCNE